MAVTSTFVKIVSTPGQKKEGYHDHPAELIGGYKDHQIDQYVIRAHYKTQFYGASSDAQVPLNGQWHSCTLISKGKNFQGQAKDQYAISKGQDLNPADKYIPIIAKEPLVESKFKQFAETQAEIEQDPELLKEAIKIRKTLP